MTREIKFRAWHKRENRMIYAEEAKNDKMLLAIGLHGLPIAVDSDSFRDNEVIGWNIDHYIELMQYTGIKDRKGQEICEGDIVRSDDESIGVIKYNKGCFYYDDWIDGWTSLEDIYAERFAVVLGNVYEHPHLIDWSKEE